MGFRWKAVVGNENRKMENRSGLRTENESGELRMENYSNWLLTENKSGGLYIESIIGDRLAAE